MIDLKNNKKLSFSSDLSELISFVDDDNFLNETLDLVIKSIREDRDFTLFWNRFNKTIKVHFVQREVEVEMVNKNDLVSWIPMTPYFKKELRTSLLELLEDRDAQLGLLKDEMHSFLLSVQDAALTTITSNSHNYWELDHFYKFYVNGWCLPIDVLSEKARRYEIYDFCVVLSPYDEVAFNEIMYPQLLANQDNKKIKELLFDSNLELFDFYTPFESEIFNFLLEKFDSFKNEFEKDETFFSLGLLSFVKLFKLFSANLGKVTTLNSKFSSYDELHNFFVSTLSNLMFRMTYDETFVCVSKTFDLMSYGVSEEINNEVNLLFVNKLLEQSKKDYFLSSGRCNLKDVMSDKVYSFLRFESELIILESFTTKRTLQTMRKEVLYSPFALTDFRDFKVGFISELKDESFTAELETELIANSALTTKEVKGMARYLLENHESITGFNFNKSYLNHLKFVLELEEVN